MFNKEFYPTPRETYLMMQVDCSNKTILEPQAGKGDIVDYLQQDGAKEVIAYERNEDLNKIVQSKCRVLGYDFFDCKPEDISHVDAIVMNPPFSNADKHIVHAFKIAPEGCEITALCNYATVADKYSHRELQALIRDYGTEVSLGNCFDTAERKTNVEVGLIKLYKPLLGENRTFDGFFMDEEEIPDNQQEGLMTFNEVRALVNRYVAAMKCFDKMNTIKEELNRLSSPLGTSIDLRVSRDEQIITKEDYSKALQKTSWNYIFGKMNMKKYVTKGVMEDVNKFVEQQHNIPFTEKNIYHMFNIIFQTRQQNFDKAIIEVIDNYTKHHHENRFGVEGWKTNEGYMLNQKFIINYMTELSFSDRLTLKTYSDNFARLDDMIKVLCTMTGENYDRIPDIRISPCDLNEEGYLTSENRRVKGHPELNYKETILGYDDFKTNTWYDWGFFQFKVFKKGTMHLKFKDKETWYMLNQAYGKLKGFTLPETYKK